MRALSLSFMFVVLLASMPAAAAIMPPCVDTNTGNVDSDCDGVFDFNDNGDPVDNCRFNPNGDCDKDPLNCDVDRNGAVTTVEISAGEQIDWNHDGEGNACDYSDKDQWADYLDNCVTTDNDDQNPKACVDTDGDYIEDNVDNCIPNYNPTQYDRDSDKIGDACDVCFNVYNPEQNSDACPSGDDGNGSGNGGEGGGGSPIISTPQAPVDGQWQQGNGGCSLTPGSTPHAIAILGFLAALILATFRKAR